MAAFAGNECCADKVLGIYVHWPFCVRKCNYCAFVSQADTHMQHQYACALTEEIRAAGSRYNSKVDTVFFGGGTPSYAPQDTLPRILRELRSSFDIVPAAEITVEANPESITDKGLEEWMSAGVNRLSIGLQSATPAHLTRLGRTHTMPDFLNAFTKARRTGFSNISVDLMYALPGQTIEEWRDTLDLAVAISPQHCSCYALTLERGTPLARDVEAGRLELPEEEDEVSMFWAADSILTSAGYDHYEISNFARSGFECKHNMKYWMLDDYLGLGAAAHSKIGRYRFSNTESVTQYIEDHAEQGLKYATSEHISTKERENEFMMLRTRLRAGFTEAEYRREFERNICNLHAAALEECIADGLIEVQEGLIQPTLRGFLFNNQVAVRLMRD